MIKKELVKIKISKIQEYELNNKTHNDYNIGEIKKSIKRNNYVAPIIVDENNVILAGHGRKLALEDMGKKEVEVLRITGQNAVGAGALRKMSFKEAIDLSTKDKRMLSVFLSKN